MSGADANDDAALLEAQRTRNALLSSLVTEGCALPRGDKKGTARSDSDDPFVWSDVMRAPAPRPFAMNENSGGGDGALANAVDGRMFLSLSPFPQRRPTIIFKSYDRPWDGDKVHAINSKTDSDSDGASPVGKEGSTKGSGASFIVVPHPLPIKGCACPQHHTSISNGHQQQKDVGEREGAFVRELTVEKDGATGPYSRPLTFIFADDAVPFTAVLTTLAAAAGFTKVSGRAALLHKTSSLQWLKRPLRSDFVRVNITKFQKLNHFPGTGPRLENKDTLHAQVQIAKRRWQRGGTTKDDEKVDDDEGWDDMFPRGWIIPDDLDACQRHLRCPRNAGAIFIVKPAGSACGRGMHLLRAAAGAAVPLSVTSVDITSAPAASPPLSSSSSSPKQQLRRPPPRPTNHSQQQQQGGLKVHDRLLIQKYIADPFLAHGYKFDVRLYVVVTSYEPCRFYLYKEGLVRFATTPYHRRRHSSSSSSHKDGEEGGGGLAPLEDLTAHLTNFTINKKSEDFIIPSNANTGNTGNDNNAAEEATAASKWCLAKLESYLRRLTGPDGRTPLVDWDGTMARIHDLLRRTFLSVAPEVRAELRRLSPSSPSSSSSEVVDAQKNPPFTFRGVSPFFEIYGVDVLLRGRPPPPSKVHGDTSAPPLPQPLGPVLMEVNIMPSLSTHYSPLDQCVKGNFIADTLTLVGLTTPLIAAPKRPTPCPGALTADNDAAAGGVCSYGDSFLDSVASVPALEACLTAEEELRRAPHFHRLMPTAGSHDAYRSLLLGDGEDVEDGGGDGSSLDAVLSAYETWKAQQQAVVM